MVNTSNNSTEVMNAAPEVPEESGGVLGASINVGNVAEAVGKLSNNPHGAGAQVTTQDDSQSTTFDFGSIAAKISSLLFDNKVKEVILPKVSVQKLKVKKSLEKQTKSLIKEANKIQNARHFSADKLEKVVQQIRYLQKILDEIMTAMTERIESLYKKFVIGKSV